MFNTYIYGTPFGFDFYEDITSLEEYFKGFYISTRKGRRLMVNRRDDGGTFYHYLCYGLTDNINRRNNAFFGMSVSVDNNEYSDDFKDIFDWFDYLFEKLVQRGNLFFVNNGNVVQYKVAKFKDCAEEIQWLKGNIPNIFTKNQGVRLLRYDSTFSAVASGQIRCFNDGTPHDKILEAFKKYRWIAVSPGFKPEEEPIEIDIYDIDSQLNKYTQQLVPIAISAKRENLNTLYSIEKGCVETVDLIQKYLSAEHDTDERNSCTKLIDKAKEIIRNAKTIEKKIGAAAPPPVSPVPRPVVTPTVQPDVPAPKPETKPRKEWSASDYLDPKTIAIALVVVLIIGVSWALIKGGKSSDSRTGRDYSADVVDSVTDNKVNGPLFDEYLDRKDFAGAYEEIDGKEDFYTYLPKLKNSVETYLWELICRSGYRGGENALMEFFIPNKRLVDALGLDQDLWNQYAQDYNNLIFLLNRSSFSPSQREEANRLLTMLPDNFYDKGTFRGMIDNMPDDSDPSTHKVPVTQPGSSGESPYIVMINSDGSSTKISRQNTGYDRFHGDKVILKSIRELIVSGPGKQNVTWSNDNKQITIDVKAGERVIVSDGKITVTINGKLKKV